MATTELITMSTSEINRLDLVRRVKERRLTCAKAGTLIGRIVLPERVANLCFGGVKRNRLFMAASQSLYALYVNAHGATLS